MKFPGDNLVVFAHPDDETIYFGGLLLSGIAEHADLLCVTDGNANGRGPERLGQLESACKAMKVRRVECLGYMDHPMRHLPIADVGDELRRRVQEGEYRAVFTHSAHGEYGHFNHMDVSAAVHEYLGDLLPVYSVADILFPDFQIQFTPETYARKIQIMTDVYFDEIKKGWRKHRALAFEGYVELDLAESRAIYRLCTAGERPADETVPRYRPHLRFLEQPWR